MTKNFKRLIFYFVGLSAFILTSVTLRTVACITEFNPSTGYFDGKICITIADWLAVFGVCFSLSYIGSQRQNIKFAASFDNAATYIPAGLVSAALFFVSAELFVEATRAIGGFSISAMSRSGNLLTLILSILALAGVGSFLLRCLVINKESALRGGFDIAFIVFSALLTAYLYFDVSAPLNSPAKITDEMAFLLISVFFLYETRISLGREMWRPYIAFGMAAALVSAYSSIPAIILYFVKDITISNSISQSVLALTISAFIICRLLLILTLPEDKKCPAVEAILFMQGEKERIKAENQTNLARAKDINEENSIDEQDNSENYTFNIEEISNISSENMREDG